MQTNDGRLTVVGGATRSGKTAYVVKKIKGEKRVIVWDIEAQFCELPGFKKITTRAELFAAIQRPGPAKLAYVPGPSIAQEFDFWAACVLYWGKWFGGCVAVAEELADVTSPAKAPGNWGILLRRGLKRAITIFAISQRWAEADKTAIGNASEFVLFRLSSGDDIAYMARKTRVQAAQLEGLQPLEYVTVDAVTGKTARSKLKFS